jgi:hypothetical protein
MAGAPQQCPARDFIASPQAVDPVLDDARSIVGDHRERGGKDNTATAMTAGPGPMTKRHLNATNPSGRHVAPAP